MTKSIQGYSTGMSGSGRKIPASLVLALLHIVAATFIHWPITRVWCESLRMSADLAFHHLQAWRLITGTYFFQGDTWEVVWLVLFLFLFGYRLEKDLGRLELLWFYGLAGTFCCLIWGISAIAWADILVVRTAGGLSAVAWVDIVRTSGAITAVIVLTLILEPGRRFHLLGLPIPAWSLAILYYGVEFRFYAWDSWTMALPVHLAGAILALLYRQFDLRGARLFRTIRKTTQLKASEPVPPRVETPEQAVEPAPDRELEEWDPSQLDSQVDFVLEKISRAGSSSLTEQEIDLLRRASQHYRQRLH